MIYIPKPLKKAPQRGNTSTARESHARIEAKPSKTRAKNPRIGARDAQTGEQEPSNKAKDARISDTDPHIVANHPQTTAKETQNREKLAQTNVKLADKRVVSESIGVSKIHIVRRHALLGQDHPQNIATLGRAENP